MTPGDLARVADIRARADAATPPPWVAHFTVHGDPSVVTDPNRPGFSTVAVVSKSPDDYGRANNGFIAAARSDVPWLLDRLAAETERADKAEAVVRAKVFAEVDAALVREAAKPLGDSVRLGIGVARLAVRSQLRNGCPTCSGPIRETVGMVCQTCGTDYGATG